MLVISFCKEFISPCHNQTVINRMSDKGCYILAALSLLNYSTTPNTLPQQKALSCSVREMGL